MQVGQQQVNMQLGNVKKQKLVAFVNKTREKRIVTFSGLVAKLQQSLGNGDEQFIYFFNKKVAAFLTLLRENGVIHNFHCITQEVQWKSLKAYLSPAFDSRVLVVHLKTADKHGPALKSFKMFTIPSRPLTMSYRQLVEKVQIAGPATLYVLNTQRGLLTHTTALRHKLGGEVVCEIK